MLSSISGAQLGIILLIVIIIFGTKKVALVGKDLGDGVKGFRDGFKEVEEAKHELDKELNW